MLDDKPDPITMVSGIIRNPDEPRHYMKLKPVPRRITIRQGDQILAETRMAVRVIEVGYDLYDPPLYIPPADIRVTFASSDRSTHCPLKGDATYWSLKEPGGEDIAWSYEDPFDFARGLTGLVAFDAGRVTI